jgi:2'-hydroxyisoflavone reductase
MICDDTLTLKTENTMNRRDALKLTSVTALGSLLSSPVFAAAKTLRVLILGGTGFIGPHFVEALRVHGHTLTLFNRGKRNPGLFKDSDVETLIGDRDGKLDALKGHDWDVVIDDSGRVPRQVQLSADLLKGHVKHYIFISSISAYADLSKPNLDEDAPLAKLDDPTVEKVTDGTYGGMKALCEQIVTTAYGAHSTIIRPSYIVGPGDPTDRFTYWPVRVSRGGEMLVPGTAKDPMQFIDSRDLAEFVRLCVERRIAGKYNLCNAPHSVSMGAILETSTKISGADTHYVWADAEFLDANKALESGEIPIWSPTTGETAGASLISCSRAVKQGLGFRSLHTTVADTLTWQKTRPEEQQQKLRAGFTPEREAELIKMLKSRKS